MTCFSFCVKAFLQISRVIMRISSVCIILVCSKNNLRHLLLAFLRGYNFALLLKNGEVVNTHTAKERGGGSKD